MSRYLPRGQTSAGNQRSEPLSLPSRSDPLHAQEEDTATPSPTISDFADTRDLAHSFTTNFFRTSSHQQDLAAAGTAASTARPTQQDRNRSFDAGDDPLLKQATAGAKQQAAARDTMLNMASAFEDLLRHEQQLQAAVWQEEQKARQLCQERDRLQAELDDAKVEEWRMKLARNKQLAKNLLLLSRRALPLDRLAVDSEPDGCSEGRSAHAGTRELGEKKTHEGGADGLEGSNDASRGDMLTLKCVLHAWKVATRTMCERRARERSVEVQTELSGDLGIEGLEADICRLSQERAAEVALRRQLEDALAESECRERAAVAQQAALKDKVNDLVQTLSALGKEHALKLEELEGERAADKKRMKDKVHSLAAEKDAKMEKLRMQLQEQEDNLHRDKLAWENEKKAMITQLEGAMETTRQLRNAALRQKRSASANISAEDFEKLMSYLASMQKRLHALNTDWRKAADQNIELKQKLGKTTRAMELERQFLPLVHTVRGCVSAVPRKIAMQQSASLGVMLGTGEPTASADPDGKTTRLPPLVACGGRG